MSIGIWQVVLILLIVLIVFGAGKLPKVMGDVAAGVKNFRKGMRDDETGDDDTTTSKSIGQDADAGAPAAERKREDETVKS
jgi:sec-independent protein translocase protein TatA